jgi:hypothetical protein
LSAASTDDAVDPAPQELEEAGASQALSSRLVVAISLPTIGAAVMVGGAFDGIAPRPVAGVAGVLGVLVAVAAGRARRPTTGYAVILGGILGVGVLMVLPTGIGNIAHLRAVVVQANAAGSVLRPPVPFTPGWHAILGWLMAIVGFSAGWIVSMFRKPTLGLLLPVPVAIAAAISVPAAQQVPSGAAMLVLFLVGLGVLANDRAGGDDPVPLSFELRRVARAVPLIAAMTAGVFLLARADFLFPDPAIDPTQEAQKPKTVPLSEVPDRVLFEVKSTASGPWRLGSLDVYDGKDWRLPPFAGSKLVEVPRSGIVDDKPPGIRATIEVKGLTGAVLVGLPNLVGIKAEGPKLAYDGRSGNIRTTQGQVLPGQTYTVVAAAIPSVEDLDLITTPIAKDVLQFAKIGPPPPAVADLISRAPKDSKWREFDFLRTFVLENVTATGSGVPTSIDAARVDDMIAGSREASPFEIVAAQAMLARWIGLPSRIGYGFDKGDVVGDVREVRPRNGATFVEVYFQGYGWLPVIGTPKKAKPTVGSQATQQQTDAGILPSEDISVQVFAFVVTPGQRDLTRDVRRVVAVVVPIAALGGLVYLLLPVVQKRRRRNRRRRDAMDLGPRARVALAYAEWRDLATDLGLGSVNLPPLAFLRRFSYDEEHAQLAWLVTRSMWGDLLRDVTDEHAATAELLSRSLIRRLKRQQPATLRAVALVSRLSLRHPFSEDTVATEREEVRRAPALAR